MKTEYTTEDWEKLHEEFFSLAREITDIRLHGKLLSMFIKAFNVGLGLGFEEGMNFERFQAISEKFMFPQLRGNSKHGSEKIRDDIKSQTRLSGGTTPMEVVQ